MSRSGWLVDFFTSFYLGPCIWSDGISRWIRQWNSITPRASLRKSATESLATIRQAFGKKTWAVNGKSKLTETGEEQSQEHAHYFLWHQRDCSQRIRAGRPNSQFRILLCCSKVTAWKFAKTSPGTLATKELAVASRRRTISHFHLTKGFFYRNQRDCAPTHPTFLFPRLKTKLKGRHFDTAEVMEAEPQAVLNSLTEHGFQDAFRHGRGWERCIGAEGDCFESEGGQ
jgi:hypothetical protein